MPQHQSWTKWVIGTLGTLTMLFMGFYFQGLSKDISALERSKVAVDVQISNQNERLASLEARETAMLNTLAQISKDVRETRDAILRQSVR